MTALIVIVFMNSARKNEREADARVLGVEPADELLLGLDEVERRAVHLGRGGDDEDDERQEPGGHEIPVAEAFLDVDDAAGRQRAGDEQHGGEAEPEGSLVADHLRRSPHRAEQRVLRPARPPGEHDPVDRDRRQGEHEQDADRRVGQLHPGLVSEPRDDAVVAVAEVAAERDHRPHEERGHERQERGEPEHEPVRSVRQQSPP